MRIEALQHSSLYEKNGHTLSADMNTNTLAHKYARLYAKQKDQVKLEAVIEYIPDPARRVRYWKDCGRYEKALDIYIEEKLYDSAYRLISGQGWYDKGLECAEKCGKTDWRVNFTIQKAQFKLYTVPNALDDSMVSSLRELLHVKSQRFQAIAAIQLLLGQGTGNSSCISQAIEVFRVLNHKVGELEAYGQLFHILKHEFVKKQKDAFVVLSMCQTAQEYAHILSQPAGKNLLVERVLQQSLDFHGLKVAGDIYCIPPNQNIWIQGLKQCQVKDEPCDLDGMMRLDVSKTRKMLASHLVALSEQFYKDTGIETFLHKNLTQVLSAQFCTHLSAGLLKSPSVIFDSDGLSNYISAHIHWIEYCRLTSYSAEPRSTEGPIRQLLTLYQPTNSIYLPLGKYHLKSIRSSAPACIAINTWIKTVLDKITIEEVGSTDAWLVLWRACCIVGKDGGRGDTVDLMSRVKMLTNEVSQIAKRTPYYRAPPSFIFWKRENQHHHHFFFWLRSCDLIRKDKDITSAAQCIVKHFLPHIAHTAKRGSRISVMNVVELLSIHTTALLAVIACTLQRRKLAMTFKVRVPHMYQHVVKVFDNLNTQSSGDRWLLKACIFHVEEAWRNRRVIKVSSRALELLCDALELLLGFHEALPVLKFALTDPDLLLSGASCHCLILALTIVANLAVVCRSNARTYLHYKAMSIEERCSNGVKALSEILSAVNIDGCPGYIKEACNIMCSPEWSIEVFGLIQYLIQQCYPDWGVAEMYRPSFQDIVFNPIKCRSKLLSTSVQPDHPELSSSIDESSGYETISSQQEEFTEEFSEQPEEEVAWEEETENDELKIAEESMNEEQPQHTLEDMYVINNKYCTLCDVELDSQQVDEEGRDGQEEKEAESKDRVESKEGTESKDEADSKDRADSAIESTTKLQTYEDHIQSQVHIDRKKIFEKYKEIDEEYSKILNEMLKVLEELTHASKVYYDEDSPFAELMDKMETEMENNAAECEKIKENKNWQEGVMKLPYMAARVHDLTQLGRSEADKMLKRLPVKKTHRNMRINVEEELEDADITLDIVEQ